MSLLFCTAIQIEIISIISLKTLVEILDHDRSRLSIALVNSDTVNIFFFFQQS